VIRHVLGFRGRQPADAVPRFLARQSRLVQMRRAHVKHESRMPQNFRPPWRARCKNEFHDVLAPAVFTKNRLRA
jgi:hypothetical protein